MHPSITDMIAAAPEAMQPALRELSRDVAGALHRFGVRSDRDETPVAFQIAYAMGACLRLLACQESGLREDNGYLPAFLPEAFGQRAMEAALAVTDPRPATRIGRAN